MTPDPHNPHWFVLTCACCGRRRSFRRAEAERVSAGDYTCMPCQRRTQFATIPRRNGRFVPRPATTTGG